MNIQTSVEQDSGLRPLALDVDQFWHLKKAGAFSRYSKSELLDGCLSGVPLQEDHEPESDAPIPIRLRVRDYLSLADAGLLVADGKTELLDGVLYEMSPQYRPHWYIKNELTYRLRRALEGTTSSLYVGSEGSVFLSEFDLPEPDIVITSEPVGGGPIPLASVRLLVEVADSSRTVDLGRKLDLYAFRGVPEYWVADVNDRVIHQMWAPIDGAYAEQRVIAFGDIVTAATIDGLRVPTGDL